MRVARTGAELLAWWAVATGIWMVSLSIAPLQEWLLAAACGFPCALAALWARRVLGTSWTLRAAWLKPVLTVPYRIVTDAAEVLLAVVRPGQPGGRFDTVRTGARGDSPEARSRRALATFLLSVTPGTYVLDADPDSGDVLVHSLTARQPGLGALEHSADL